MGGLHRNEAFDMGPQPDYTTPTELRMMRDGDKRESPSTQRVTGVEDSNGLIN